MTTLPRPALDALVHVLPVGIAVLDEAGRLLYANESVRRLAVPPETGACLFTAWPELTSLERAYREAIASGLPFDETRDVTTAAGAEVRLRLLTTELEGRACGLLLVDDNTRARETERALGQAEDQALRDPLTGLFNRRHLEALLPVELDRARRLGLSVSLLIVDADHFKRVNDRFGHPAGDGVLKRLAQTMTRVFRQGDTCARIGGEEFCAVLPRADLPQAVLGADRLHRIVRALRFEGEPDLRVTVSVGIASLHPTVASDWEAEGQALFARADAALYRAKQDGRNRTETA